MSLPPKDTFPSGDVHMAQESGHGSGGTCFLLLFLQFVSLLS